MSFSEERHRAHGFGRERNQKYMGGAEGEENTIRIHWMSKESIFNKREKARKKLSLLKMG